MAAGIAREVLTEEEQYADAEYRRFLKEKDKYIDFDEFCREQGIWSIAEARLGQGILSPAVAIVAEDLIQMPLQLFKLLFGNAPNDIAVYINRAPKWKLVFDHLSNHR